MSAPNISFAKIVATPTKNAWSQAYNAGSLFLALSLTTEDEGINLAEEGKKLLDHIQAEFFGLEEKSLTTIETTLNHVVAKTPHTVSLSLSLGFIKENILYCFLKGQGEILLKRGETRLPILKGFQEDEIMSASGYLKTDDLLLLQTAEFTSLIPETTLKEAFEYPLPNDIAETITPHVHNSKEGGASAIILAFKGIPQSITTEEDTEQEKHLEASSQEKGYSIKQPQPYINRPSPQPEHEPIHAVSEEEGHKTFLTHLRSRLGPLLPAMQLTVQQKLIAAAAVILVLLLVGGSIMTIQNQESAAQDELFASIYPQALEAYTDGENLLSLNEALAREDFLRARELLSQLEGKFPPESEEAKEIQSLQEKITARIGSGEDDKKLSATEANENDAPVLAALRETPSAVAGILSENTVYLLTDDAILSYPDEKIAVENEEIWSNPVNLGVYGTNFYVLDTQKGLLKLVPTEEGYASSSYFTENEPNLSQSISLAIDGSIYILMKDGTIEKYTRGEQEAFTVDTSDLTLQTPAQLVTSPEMESLYLLDNGLGQVLKVGKDAALERVYQADVLKNAKAISVSDDETALFVLQNDTLYSLPLE